MFIGWGTMLNELFIYSITYLWAVVPLFYKGISSLIKNKKNLLGIMMIFIIGMCLYNTVRLIEIVEFGIQNYPSITAKLALNKRL